MGARNFQIKNGLVVDGDITAASLDVSGNITLAEAKAIYFDSTDTSITTNTENPEDLFISADQDLFLRPDNDILVQTGSTTYALFDGGNQRVGIGTTSPGAPLHVSKTLTGNDADTLTGAEVFRIDSIDDGSSSNGPGFQIRLESTSDHNGSNYEVAIIGNDGGQRKKNIFGNYGFHEYWLAGNADGKKPIAYMKADGSTSASGTQYGVFRLLSTATAWAANNFDPSGETTALQLNAGGDSYFNGGDVGIGTTSPDTILHVSSATHPSIRITGTDNAGADPAIEMLGQGNSFSEGMQMWYDNGAGIAHIAALYDNSAGDLQFHTRTGADRSTSNVRMTIEADGNVGIGTTSPATPLDIKSGGSGSRTSFNAVADDLVVDSTGDTGITVSSSNTATGNIFFADDDNDSRGQIRYDHSGNTLRFATSGTERFRVGSSGELGIGGANYGTSGQVLTSGGSGAAPTWEDAASGGGVSLSGSTNDQLVTVTGSNAIKGESNLTLSSAGDLALTGTMTMTDTAADDTTPVLTVEQNRTTDHARLAKFIGNGNEVLSIRNSGRLHWELSTDGGASEETIMSYNDINGDERNFMMIEQGTIVINNRGPNGDVEIRANTSTIGSGGEVSVANFQDDRVILNTDVGIGTSSPQANLHVSVSGTSTTLLLESTDSGATDAPILELYRNSSSPANTDDLGQILWSGEKSDGSKYSITKMYGQINTVDNSDRLMINIASSGGSGLNNYEYMRFDGGVRDVIINEEGRDIDFRIEGDSDSVLFFTDASSDRIGIGTNSPDAKLHVSSGTDLDCGIIIEADTDNNDEADLPFLWFKQDGDITVHAIQATSNRLQIINNISASGGIDFAVGTTNNTGTTDPSTGTTAALSIESDGGVQARKTVIKTVSSNTTLADEDSGKTIYWTGGSLTLPATAQSGQQFVVINNKGSSATPGLGTSNSIQTGWTAHAAMDDETARTYIAVAANKWIYIG